jgi:hypothetical protein
MARIQKVKQILTENLVPETAPFGTVFVCKDTQQVWIAVLSGEVLNLSDVLEGKNVLASKPAKHGRDGKDGVGTKGERGERGEASVTPGPAGRNGIDGSIGAVGLRGERGERGEASTVHGLDSAQVLLAARTEIAAIHKAFEDLKLIVTAIHDQNRQVNDYLNYLRSKRRTIA